MVDARTELIDRMDSETEPWDFDACFHAHYPRIARAIARIVGDNGRAEEIAVEAFWKLWRTPRAHGENAGGWLYRTAVRLGLNDLRGSQRRDKYERQADTPTAALTPEEVRAAEEERRQVRCVLAALDPRDAELLLLRSHGLSYDELAAAIDVKPTSVGTLISRAQQAFRKEYLRLYGER
jgi:RNA polymerase sigma-70 factor (ECF subfamily)